MTSSRLEHLAVEYATHGYHVFPCRARGKKPITPHGFHDASVDERQILQWWDRTPAANIGVACAASRLIALDIDSKSGADPREVIDELNLHGYPIIWTGEAPDRCARYPNSLPGVRGAQMWFAGDLPTVETTLPGVEIRGAGSYVMAPGSVHPCGIPYDGSVPPAAKLPPIPEQVQTIAIPEPAAENGRTPTDVWLRMLEHGIPETTRHRSLLRLIGHLLRRYIDPDLAAAIAHTVNQQCCKPPLPPSDVDDLVEDVCKAELRRRNGDPS